MKKPKIPVIDMPEFDREDYILLTRYISDYRKVLELTEHFLPYLDIFILKNKNLSGDELYAIGLEYECSVRFRKF